MAWLRAANRCDYFFLIFTFWLLTPLSVCWPFSCICCLIMFPSCIAAEGSISNWAFFHLQKNIGRPLHTSNLTAIVFRSQLKRFTNISKRHFYRKEIKFSSNWGKQFSPHMLHLLSFAEFFEVFSQFWHARQIVGAKIAIKVAQGKP